MQIGLLFSARCNAACTHCATSCGPDKTTTLSRDALFRLMDEAAETSAGGDLIFSLSGGEPFLDFTRLLEVVRHGRRLGGEVTCVTNGYWAASDGKARALTAALKEAGLSSLGVSTSRFHQRYVRLERAQRALAAARAAGLGTVLKYAMTRADQSQADEIRAWAEAAGVGKIEIFPVLPSIREGASLPEEDFLFEPGIPEGVCPIPSLTLREDGTAYSCCAPGGFVDFLALGNALDEGVRAVYRRFLLNGTQQILRKEGPARFAQAIRDRGLGELLRQRYVGICDLCSHIASEPRLARVAGQVAAAHEREYLQAAFAKLTVASRTPGAGGAS